MAVQPSEKWLKQYNSTLVPEMFVQITYHASDDKAQSDAIASSGSQVVFSDVSDITNLDNLPSAKYATGEPNLWILDGSCDILPSSEPYKNAGYVSLENVSDENHPIVTFSFSKTHEEKIPGITIVWSELFNEYATSFKVSAYNGSSLLQENQIDDNTSVESSVDFEITGYNSIVIEILSWCIPNRRARIEQVEFGQRVRFNKEDLLSYSHESKRDPISGQLSKDSISFSVNNSDQKWNPINPGGLYQYLYERQAVFVKYGMDLNGETEWINGGKFYLSNWNTPSNGITASFEARDALVFLSDSPYTGRKSGTLYEMCYDALELLDVTGISYFINESLKNYSTDFSSSNSSYKNSDVLQLAANAAGMALYQTRDGEIRVDWVPFSPEDKSSIYEISEMNNFEYPEISFSNKLKNISYSVNGASKTYPAGATGDGVTQSVSNSLFSDSIIAQPKNALTESYKVLSNRRIATLSYRASPHNDALDFVKLNHQFGYSSNLLITDVKYTFNGCFKGSVTGYMIEDVSSLQIDQSEIYLHPSDSITLTATLTPASADSPVIIWNASPPSVVELNVTKNERGVSVCKLSYVHRGNATITASVSGLSTSCSATAIANNMSDMSDGSIVKVLEGGKYIDYIIAARNYESGLNGAGGTLFVRKEMLGVPAWNNTAVNAYSGSTIDTYINDNFKNALSSYVQSKIRRTKFYYTPGNGNKSLSTLSRDVFLLSAKELAYNDSYNGQMWGKGCNGEGMLLPTALKIFESCQSTNQQLYIAWTRTPVYDARYFGMPSGHNTDSAVGCFYIPSRGYVSYGNYPVTRNGDYGSSERYGYQPAFVVDSDLKLGIDNRIEE
jgi:hypothetical protein|nr:MAG TPA: hypothetical protein [Caudoviricetes sp.]